MAKPSKTDEANKVTFFAKRSGDGFEGFVTLPFPIAPVRVSTTGQNRADALNRAATAAKQITQNPLIASILPPGTPIAVEALTRLASSPTGKQLAKLVGPGGKRLKSALKRIF